MKITLGGAQLGFNYGCFNKKKIIYSEIKKIEKLVKKFDIKYIDTAINYGNSETVIGNSSLNKLNIITKIKIPNKKINIKKWINYQIDNSLKKLKKKNIYALLLHDYKDLNSKNKKEILKTLYDLKKKKIIKKIGVSIYSPNDLKTIWKSWEPEVVQAPLNIFDQRIINSGWIDILKKKKIKLFVRSCFLQGLLISNYKKIYKLKKFHYSLNKFSKWCAQNKISKILACLHFVKKYTKIDFLIVGFNNSKQLEEILNLFLKKTVKIPNKFNNNNVKLIDPRKWN
jgi:aryl-alcohol dehydrogenase-like predicted oxidoreductase